MWSTLDKERPYRMFLYTYNERLGRHEVIYDGNFVSVEAAVAFKQHNLKGRHFGHINLGGKPVAFLRDRAQFPGS